MPVFCPGRQSSAGDFINYDPWCRTKIWSCKGNRLANAVRPAVLGCHPTGWHFESIPDGWDPTSAVNDHNRLEDGVRVPGDDECHKPDDAPGRVNINLE